MIRRALCLAFLALAACESPVDDDLVESLGPENPEIEEGEFHRYGQPCLACHGNGQSPEFSVAGTVFLTPTSIEPVEGAVVTITDAIGQKVERTTNCAGNFYFEAQSFEPVFPLRAEILCPSPSGEPVRRVMGTRINREGSCAGCHVDPSLSGSPTAAQSSPGQVYCYEETVVLPRDNDCPGGFL